MDVVAARERVAQRGHFCDMGCQPQFDLRIVCRQDDIAGFGDEGVADLPPDFGADRDILEVRVGRRQPPGLRTGQAVTGMDAARLAVDLLLERVSIGGFELRQLPPVEHLARDLDAFRRQPLHLVDVGRIDAGFALAATLQPHLFEQHVAQLLGAADSEFGAGDSVDFGFQVRHLGCEFFR